MAKFCVCIMTRYVKNGVKKIETSMLTISEKSNKIWATSGSDWIIIGNRHVVLAVSKISVVISTSTSVTAKRD